MKITEVVDVQVKEVLANLGFGDYCPIFVEKEVDYEAFLRLKEDDLKKMMEGSGKELPPGLHKKISAEIERLNKAPGITMTGNS